MTTMEKINELKANFDVETETTKEVYLQIEAELVGVVGKYVNGAEMLCKLYGPGKIVAFDGMTLDSMIVDIAFKDDTTRRFSLMHIMSNNFIKFADIAEIGDIWDSALEAHNKMTSTYREHEQMLKQQQIEAEKRVEAEKKAEEKYQRQKEHAIQTFDQLVANAGSTLSESDEFYYALGWLANHVGAMTAILPDYLGSAFEQHFGTEAPKTLVDGRAKTSGGYAKQWSWEFKCTIKKLKETVVPACIQSVTADFSKGIHNTAFLWDLVSNHGFQFGKKQDIEKIKDTVPAQFITSFETGLTA